MINDGTRRLLSTSVLTQYNCRNAVGVHRYGVFPTDLLKFDERALSFYFGERNYMFIIVFVSKKAL